MSEPLVSCIMPTYNRRKFLPHAIRYFLRQDYPHKELIIVDDGTDNIEDLVPDLPGIHYHRLNEKITLGAKLNMACQHAHGDIIANWDDDDWYAPRRLTYQVNALQDNQTYICGINKLLYYDLHSQSAFQYVYPAEQRTWLLGSSLCYKKEFWNHNRFADINVGMDGLFVWRTTSDHVSVLSDSTFSVHMIHSSNVSPKQTDGGWWHRYSVDEIKKIMDGDWNFYNGGKVIPLTDVHQSTSRSLNLNANAGLRPIRNIYACLVHENEDCIIDLVRNLHYNDPSSIVLLYNGGDNPRLFGKKFPYQKFGAVIYPDPAIVRWGYLHDFALRCMEFALKNFSFDTITMVDSDQLCMRQGYSHYLGAFLMDRPGIGMLSNMPDRITRDNRTNHVAAQAFKEYELWKPLLQSFDNGEYKFVHWTFWPSTVFTADSSRDLVKVFKENKMLSHIMKQTKIWATEEVILPTLVRLLGYEIGLTPCSYDFIKFKKQFSLQDADAAMRMNNVYWMHPIERKYENALRKYVRQKAGHYFSDTSIISQRKPSTPMLHISSLISRVKKIEGWLSEQETDLLISTTIKTCVDFAPPQNILEIGSYHGKSTVAMGNVVKSLFPKARVYAVDPHNGVVGAADQGLQKLPPSLQMFKQNIEAEKLSDVVDLIRDFSYNVRWDKPIHMMFIDGLHDYPNVAKDFWHFSEWMVPGAYIAFHDYADYYPGVMAFVNELLATDEFVNIELAGSLIVLQKKTDNKA